MVYRFICWPHSLPFLVCLLLCAQGAVLWTQPSYAASPRVDRQTLRLDSRFCNKTVQSIDFAGLKRTHAQVVRRELLVKLGQELDCSALRETVQRLRNLGIFRRVDVNLAVSKSDRGAVQIQLNFDEKWTLLPIMSAGRGGGRLYLLLGVTDSHLAGRYLQLQAYWYVLAGTQSGVISLADPRLWHRRYRAAMVVEHGNRNRFLYRSGLAPFAAWSRRRDRVSLFLSDLRRPKHTWGVALHGLSDSFSTRLLDAPLQRSNGNALLAKGSSLPTGGMWLLPQMWLKFGRLDRDDYLEQRGYVRLTVTAGLPVSTALAGSAWARLLLEGKWGWLAPIHAGWLRRLNVVARARLGTQAGSHPEQRFFVGGLGSVRGYWEGRFVGDQMAVINVEARLPSWHGRRLVVQHVAFVDAGWALSGPLTTAGWKGGPAVGAGVRLILPLIARFIARIDVAWAVADESWRISLGSQQFF